MTVQAALCQTWLGPKLLVFSCTGSILISIAYTMESFHHRTLCRHLLGWQVLEIYVYEHLHELNHCPLAIIFWLCPGLRLRSAHYENMPILYTAIFSTVTIANFIGKKTDTVFLIFLSRKLIVGTVIARWF